MFNPENLKDGESLVRGTFNAIADALSDFNAEGKKWEAGNNASRSRARKALQEIRNIAIAARKASMGKVGEAEEEAA